MPSPKQKLSTKTLIALIVLGVIAFICGCIGYYYYTQYTQLKTNPQAMSTRETQQIISQVKQLMQLPSDETPQVATVVNPTLVQSHSPFTQAETGDVILIYTKLKRAILYRPSVNKIVDVAPVIIGAANPTVLPSPTETITISTTVTSTPSPSPTGKAKLHVLTTP